jgi:hypothetical protein
MAITQPVYATREDVRAALDFADGVRSSGRIDRALDSASRSVEGLLLRRFYPEADTRTFDWPNLSGSRPWRLWLDRDELISVTTLTVAGEAIAAADFFLRPDTGPPYTHVEIDLASSASFSAGDTHQRAIEITGVFGYTAQDDPAGALESAIASTSTTSVDVTNSALIGVGDLIKIDTERMLVTAKAMLDTTQNLQTSLTASMANATVAVTTGAAYNLDETILIDAERMLILDIAGNNLVVQRAVDGTTLAAHTAPTADIYAPRTLTVTRGALGTTAATHDDAATITRHVVPGPVRALCIAETLNELQQESAAYAKEVGADDTGREAPGAGLVGLRESVRRTYGRRARVRAV